MKTSRSWWADNGQTIHQNEAEYGCCEPVCSYRQWCREPKQSRSFCRTLLELCCVWKLLSKVLCSMRQGRSVVGHGLDLVFFNRRKQYFIVHRHFKHCTPETDKEFRFWRQYISRIVVCLGCWLRWSVKTQDCDQNLYQNEPTAVFIIAAVKSSKGNPSRSTNNASYGLKSNSSCKLLNNML